jgi:hypothetical protein
MIFTTEMLKAIYEKAKDAAWRKSKQSYPPDAIELGIDGNFKGVWLDFGQEYDWEYITADELNKI